MLKTLRPLWQNIFSNMKLKLTIGNYCSIQLSGAIYLQNSNIVEGRERKIWSPVLFFQNNFKWKNTRWTEAA